MCSKLVTYVLNLSRYVVRSVILNITFTYKHTFRKQLSELDLAVTWVCVHDLTWHQNDLKVD